MFGFHHGGAGVTIDEISTWLQDRLGQPAPPRKAAEELNRCTSTSASTVQWGILFRSIEARFCTKARKQFSDQQMAAIRDAADFGAGTSNAAAFPNLNRARISFQLMARVIDPSLVNQGRYQLCGPAAIVVSLARSHPERYVAACAELADRGRTTIGQWLIQPSDLIRRNMSPQEADWVLCASIRADTRALTDSMYGVSGADQIFDWLRRCGYQRVLLAVNFPLRRVRSEPVGLMPPGLDGSDKAAMVRTMADLTQRGWGVFLLAFGAMPTALDAVSTAGQMRLNMEAAGLPAAAQYNQTMQNTAANLRTENPSLLTLGWKMLTGTAAAHTMHVTYVSVARVQGQEIQLNCANFGRSQQWVKLPFDAFVNKFCGFAAASDLT
jgi:hypothetical protein